MQTSCYRSNMLRATFMGNKEEVQLQFVTRKILACERSYLIFFVISTVKETK